MGIGEQDDKFPKNTSLPPKKKGVYNLVKLQMNNSKPEVVTQKPSISTIPSTNQFQTLGRIKIFAGPYHHSIKNQQTRVIKQGAMNFNISLGYNKYNLKHIAIKSTSAVTFPL